MQYLSESYIRYLSADGLLRLLIHADEWQDMFQCYIPAISYEFKELAQRVKKLIIFMHIQNALRN